MSRCVASAVQPVRRFAHPVRSTHLSATASSWNILRAGVAICASVGGCAVPDTSGSGAVFSICRLAFRKRKFRLANQHRDRVGVHRADRTCRLVAADDDVAVFRRGQTDADRLRRIGDVQHRASGFPVLTAAASPFKSAIIASLGGVAAMAVTAVAPFHRPAGWVADAAVAIQQRGVEQCRQIVRQNFAKDGFDLCGIQHFFGERTSAASLNGVKSVELSEPS